MKKLIFTITNDCTFDQRMIRICTSLARAGYAVELVGRKEKNSIPLKEQPFRQKRLNCFFRKGKSFYIEYNLRLFFYLLFRKADLVCAIDLDTILPVLMATKLKGSKRVYDAHELFCEMKEIATRPGIYKFWKRIERISVPRFDHNYTVNTPIADEFRKMYGKQFEVIRNMPVLRPLTIPEKKEKYILYQGAVNEGRSFETLIPAMKMVDAQLLICGNGNFMEQAIQLTKEHGLEEKIIFLGKLVPEELSSITHNAWAGVTLFDKEGISNYFSLANRFSDYFHSGLPQLCVDYPVYREINNQYQIAVLIHDLEPDTIAKGLNTLLNDEQLYKELQENCLKARTQLNWQEEEKKLISFYSNIF
ncbi:glycosyltransferase family 4 protein [Pseudobacter ginsenosidimutans]|uniref:Glycosyltransferase involved in cell wall biosynthesis n=1 Tax=Pseudobacter ginsenosidimutans TaxID=661488 RepID=A0A4Q7N1N8_9BACT|nr:glycosyltransferase family 4 protein [Pseudobacter ginsenosidimutans]RZS75561.1 glycosyltransferase involved in cell wall biosynthesis [Pseudobacter ginsenosidimutans]